MMSQNFNSRGTYPTLSEEKKCPQSRKAQGHSKEPEKTGLSPLLFYYL